MREIWTPIPGLSHYQASSLGRIKSAFSPYSTNTPLKPFRRLTKTGRKRPPTVTIVKENGKHSTMCVCVLVCLAFHGPKPGSGYEVAHWDGDPDNNTPKNLRWATRAENRQDQKRHGTFPSGENHPGAQLTWEKVRAIRAAHDESIKRANARGRAYERGSRIALSKQFGVTLANYDAIVGGHAWVEE